MPSERHMRLVVLGAKYFKKQGFPLVATELWAHASRERVDVAAFRSTCSAMIEVKVSREDFYADRKKPERRRELTGFGNYRFYLCPKDLLTKNDLPSGWGLLYVDGNVITEVLKPKGNSWPNIEHASKEWSDFCHESDEKAERALLFSIARRLSRGEKVV